jgi:hypothetical protein
MSAIVVPSGMLRISREGEADRVVYPVHAEGWRQLGWTVHPPELELEEDDEPQDGELHGDGSGAPPDGGGEGDAAAGPEPAAELSGASGGGEPDGEGGADTEAAAEAPMPVPDFAAMTKAEIIATAAEHYGVMLDSSQTKAELVAAAQDLAAAMEAEAATAAGDGQGEGGGGDTEALVPGGTDEVAVPDLLL